MNTVSEEKRLQNKEYYAKNKAQVILRASEWTKDNPEKRKAIIKKHSESPSFTSAQLKYRNGKSRNKYLANLAKRRAKRKGLDCNITYLDITIPERCPLLDILIEDLSENQNLHSSIDRIDNDRGYTKDNIMVISHRANRLKNNATLEELELMVSNMKKLRV